MQGRQRALIAALSVVGHGALVGGLVLVRPEPGPVVAEPPAMTMALISPWVPPLPPPMPAPPSPTVSAAARSVPLRAIARRAVIPVPTPVLLAGDPGVTTGLGEAELAGAATAGSGGGDGAGCNMLRRLQDALRKDRRVQAAVGEAGGALMVWNGDWVRHPGQDGAGLAAVREAILWEVGFAPPACRVEPMKGLVVVTMSDAPGAARLALGAGTWRWRDLLFAGSRGGSR